MGRCGPVDEVTPAGEQVWRLHIEIGHGFGYTIWREVLYDTVSTEFQPVSRLALVVLVVERLCSAAPASGSSYSISPLKQEPDRPSYSARTAADKRDAERPVMRRFRCPNT